jgi:uncharacterized membrane protein
MNRPCSRLDRVLGLLPWPLGAAFAAIALHLLAILALPSLAPNSVYRRFALPTPPGQWRHFAPAAPGAPAPAYADPLAALALCRFDLRLGPLRLRAAGDGEHPLSVSVRLADGTIVYSANDRQTPDGRFNLLIMTERQSEARDKALELQEGAQDGAASDETRLIAPGKTGFVLLRALSLRESDVAAPAALLATAECKVEKAAP